MTRGENLRAGAIPAVLAGTKKAKPSRNGYVTMGGEGEAAHYAEEWGFDWLTTPGAIDCRGGVGFAECTVEGVGAGTVTPHGHARDAVRIDHGYAPENRSPRTTTPPQTLPPGLTQGEASFVLAVPARSLGRNISTAQQMSVDAIS